MELYSNAIFKIIKEQEKIIGPIAFDQARKIIGIEIRQDQSVVLKGNAKNILEKLVTQYAKLFGKASIEVCKDAVKEIHPPIPDQDLPEILR